MSADRDSASREALDARPGESADLILREATVLDPVAGIEGAHDVVIRDGRIAELAAPGAAAGRGRRVVDAAGPARLPGLLRPSRPPRAPGQEHKEDIETGTRSAAAGGYCGVIAMANTEPPVSTSADIEALREAAREGASVPTGFLATVTNGDGGARS